MWSSVVPDEGVTRENWGNEGEHSNCLGRINCCCAGSDSDTSTNSEESMNIEL